MRGRYKDFPYSPCLHTYIASSIINIPYQSNIFGTTNEPTSSQHYYSKVHSLLGFTLFVVYNLWVLQMYDDMYPPLKYHSE